MATETYEDRRAMLTMADRAKGGDKPPTPPSVKLPLGRPPEPYGSRLKAPKVKQP